MTAAAIPRGDDKTTLLEEGQTSSSADPSTTQPRPDSDQQVIDWLMTVALFLAPATGGLLFGYDIGATSGALVSLTSPDKAGTAWYNLTSFQSGAVVSLSLFGALAGSLGAFFFGDRLGRRRELLLSAGLYGLASALMFTAPNLPTLLGGRALYGLGIGFAMHAAPAYIAETTPARVRGLLISLKEAFIVVGILLGYLIGYLAIDTVGGWRTMYGAGLLPALLLGAGMVGWGTLQLWLPDSPRWLLLSGAGEQAAEANLRRAWGREGSNSAGIKAEMQRMKASVAECRAQEAGFRTLFNERNRRPLFIGSSLMLFQQITGQPSVLYYAATIFEQAGFASSQDATKVSVVLGFFKLIMTGIAVASVDSLGRRPLLLAGVSGLIVALLALSGAQELLTGSSSTWVSVAGLLTYTAAYQVSFGPISWLMVGELFPLAVRGQAAAFATFTNFGSNFLVSLALPSLQTGLGLGGTYLLFAAIGVVALASIYATVPETKGKTLEEIEALWAPLEESPTKSK